MTGHLTIRSAAAACLCARCGGIAPSGVVLAVLLGAALACRVEAGPPCASSGGFYGDAQVFQSHLTQLGIVATASWDFPPHDLPPNSSVTLDDPLNINTHALNANDPWTNNGGQNLWPAAVNNIQFSSNTTPTGSLTPRGVGGLTFATAGGSNVLSATFPQDSVDIVCESPTSGRCQAMVLGLVGPGNVGVRVYSENSPSQYIETSVNVPQGQQVFVRFIKSRIVRVDIWNPVGPESISSITLYRRPALLDIADNNDAVDVNDLLAVILNWGPCPTPPAACPANVVNTGTSANRVDADDMLAIITHWGPIPHRQCAGEDPSNGNCNTSALCPLGFCSQTGCTSGACICVEVEFGSAEGQWICTDDCCGHCV